MEQFSRRSFLRQTAAASFVAPWIGSSIARAARANEKVNIACIGVGGKGWSDMHETSVGHNIVAICDIDEQTLARAAEKFPHAKTYTDWRKLLDQPGIDAVTVSTPDHTHAPATMAAMQRGMHAFTQKPLTHSVFESRRLAEVAAEKNLITQMGIQHHATARLKTAVQLIQQGTIGPVSAVHAWTDRPGTFWKQGLDRPAGQDPIPPHVHWDQWLGVAPERPYVSGLYHRFHWRGWWDFGTGALGDMGCHLLDPVWNALELGPPRTIAAEGPPPHPESGPLWCIVRYEFPGTKHTTSSLELTWYEAGRKPSLDLFKAPTDWTIPANGVLYIGSRGNLFVGFDADNLPDLFPKGDFASTPIPQIENHNHYTEWTTAIATGGTTSCPFSYSGPLTEMVLLGNVAFRSGKTINWGPHSLKATGLPTLDGLIKRPYRAGWEVEGLG